MLITLQTDLLDVRWTLATFGVLSALQAVLFAFLPETRGKEIPDTLEEAKALVENQKGKA